MHRIIGIVKLSDNLKKKTIYNKIGKVYSVLKSQRSEPIKGSLRLFLLFGKEYNPCLM